MQKYKKIKIVGKGSFGFAVLVESRKNKKQYIMKIIDISKMNQKQIEEALMEVHLLKVIRYPYVVTYRQSFMEKMCLCIVMDYCEGGDMFHKIAKQKQIGSLFPEHQIVTWLVQMALAMNYVHDKKILHRDLKTQNIFLTSKGDIKIGDFGIARVLQHTYDCANTAIGTPYYLSPQICQQKPYNQKSDIWSLGCIFYQIATLNHAFDAQNMKGLVQKILKGTYPPLPDIYSLDLKKLLSQMLIKDPNKRPSIRKILQMDFMKVKINQLFSNTIKIHELKLQKESTCNKTQLLNFQNHKNESKKSKEKQNNMFRKKQQTSRERKIDVVSKNSSGLGFKKKQDYNTAEMKGFHKKTVQKEDINTSRSQKKQGSKDRSMNHDKEEQKMQEKERIKLYQDKSNIDKENHKKSVYEEEETLEEQGYGVLIQDMKRCMKGENIKDNQYEKIEEKVRPKFLKMQKIPGVTEKDSVGSKIEALRDYLQKQIGSTFFQAYKLIQEEEDENYEGVKKLLKGQKVKYIPLILQLIVCEDNYY